MIDNTHNSRVLLQEELSQINKDYITILEKIADTFRKCTLNDLETFKKLTRDQHT